MSIKTTVIDHADAKGPTVDDICKARPGTAWVDPEGVIYIRKDTYGSDPQRCLRALVVIDGTTGLVLDMRANVAAGRKLRRVRLKISAEILS